MLVVTCPCALSLATPVALTVASGALARVGLLVTRPRDRVVGAATHFVFDKTGTLTQGRMRLWRRFRSARSPPACLQLAAALELASEHPARTGLARCRREDLPLEGHANVAGSGVTARADGSTLRLGRPGWVAEGHGEPMPASGDPFSAVAIR